MVTAYNSLVSMVNPFREDQLCSQDQAEQPEAIYHDFDLPVHHHSELILAAKPIRCMVLVDGG